MAHMIENMAYVGETPWHQLGNQLPANQPIEVWAKTAGMDWSILEAPVQYLPDGASSLDDLKACQDQKVLYRSDTHEALSVVGGRYRIVQPRDVLEFYRELTEVSGYELETAGVLKRGKKFWALAKTGKAASLKGGDAVNGYILLATSADGSLATIAMPTTVRVVCNNTLSMALAGASNIVKVPHSTTFDAAAVKGRLGIAVSGWDDFIYRMKKLSERKVKNLEAERFVLKVLCDVDRVDAGTIVMPNERGLKRVQELFDGRGRGAELASAKGTAWGLLNAVTEYVDHERRARSREYRLDSAWFGQGAVIKQRALERAWALAIWTKAQMRSYRQDLR